MSLMLLLRSPQHLDAGLRVAHLQLHDASVLPRHPLVFTDLAAVPDTV